MRGEEMEQWITLLDGGLRAHEAFRARFVKSEEGCINGKRMLCRTYQGNCFFAEIVFSTSGVAPGVRNLLECRILCHQRDLLRVPLSRLAGFVKGDWHFYDYPFIATGEQFEEALRELLDALVDLAPQFSAFFCDGERKEAFYKELIEEVNRDCGEELFSLEGGLPLPDSAHEDGYITRMITVFFGMRLATKLTRPFTFFFEDRPARALQGMHGYSAKDGEMRRLMDLPTEQIHFSALQKQLFVLSRRPNKLIVLPLLFLAILLTSLFCAPIFAAVCGGIYAYFAGAFSSGVLYNTALGAEWYAFLVCPALFAGFIYLCFDMRLLFRMLYKKKDYKQYMSALIGKGERALTRIVGCLMLSGLLILSALQGSFGVRFEEERFTDNSEYLSLTGQHYTYEQIKEAAYVKKRPIGLKEENKDYASVILTLADGKVIDLYDFCTDLETTERVLPLLEKKGVPVTQYETLSDYQKTVEKNDEAL
ncbi:MAG: hypothetical protein IJZ37_04915 [Clostridia bacterium]|nr:hypothetical protein [Clostridia bacterium]MBQ8398587.1 hypothetical protein [Clostridia bacterium]